MNLPKMNELAEIYRPLMEFDSGLSPEQNTAIIRALSKIGDRQRCTCGHSYRFHQEHWPACKGFTPETK